MGLQPVLIASPGRSGTVALMALLGTDPRVAFDRVYPFENRHLTYLAKFATLAGREGGGPFLDQGPLYDFNNDHLGPLPWPTAPTAEVPAPLAQRAAEWLTALWAAFAAAARERHPGTTHYAEKAPAWLPSLVRSAAPCRTLHLVRDPRDVYLSAAAFNRARRHFGFGRLPGDSDLDHARTLAHGLLEFFENQRADRGRADALTVRYEDLITDPAATAGRLNRFLGLALSAAPAGGDDRPAHRTSPSPAASVGRWRREPLPPGVQSFLEAHLDEMLAFNGYESPTAARPVPAIGLTQTACASADGALVPAPGGGWAVTVTGDDFWVELPPAEFPAQTVREVWLCARADTGDHCALYWRGPREPFAETHSLRARCRPGGHWQVLRFRAAGHPLWCETVAQLRLDLFNGPVTPGRGGEVLWLRLVG
jgi:hypothetical protein